ncbi:hypothetical protein BESB_027350 [Besnoitia besnoiti]|uniref:Transmembrane protein n=1 Tax=Besnoitia besnoiti TaxID=94643 RepID=A0A2A9M7B9_BESBE|nr:uncharacterized protein BESB_027350 [Besnoitia besnoiti]PFH31300.1 hypothetical protein BESB_027350 [Besnoitia besnoiti]
MTSSALSPSSSGFWTVSASGSRAAPSTTSGVLTPQPGSNTGGSLAHSSSASFSVSSSLASSAFPPPRASTSAEGSSVLLSASPSVSSFSSSSSSSSPTSSLSHGSLLLSTSPSESVPAARASSQSPEEQQPLLSPRLKTVSDPTYCLLSPSQSRGMGGEAGLGRLPPRGFADLLPVPTGPEDEARAALLLQEGGEDARKTAEALFSAGSAGFPERDREGDAIKRLFKGLREVSHETSNAKIILWFTFFFALAAALVPMLLSCLKGTGIRHPHYQFLLAAVGGEAFLAYALPAAIVLWNLHGNDDEEANSARAFSRDRRAFFLVNVSRIMLAVFLLIVAAFSLHSHQQEAEGRVDFRTVKKTILIVAICQLASAFVFAVLAVYAWLAARLIASKAMQASAVTACAEVVVSLTNGWTHFYDCIAVAKADSIVGIAQERVKFVEYVGISMAGVLFILAAVDLFSLTRLRKAPLA